MSFEAETSYYNDLIDARTRIAVLEQELEDVEKLNVRLSRLLDATANALHGGHKENGLWSFHDLPKLATEAMSRIAELEGSISSR